MLRRLLKPAYRLRTWVFRARQQRRWEELRALGMYIGEDVLLPASTWIDVSHCNLIHIGDHTGFGEDCMILAHDAQMDEYLDAARIGRVVIHPSCHIGARSVILPGIEMGPRTLVGAGSVVARTLPANSVCAGNPATVLGSLDDYLQRHKERLQTRPCFDYATHDSRSLTPEGRTALADALRDGIGYVTGGRSAELRGEGSLRTPPAKG